MAFAGLCDWLGFEPSAGLELEVFGPRALEAGPVDRNLVLRAARALAAQIPGSASGRFRLFKRLPAAAGLGGGSADAAAALRLLASQAGLSIDDPRLRASARETGADVLACLCPRARMMWGIGDQLGPAIALPKIFALLVNPRVEAPTPKVFAALGLAPGSNLESSAPIVPCAGNRCGGRPRVPVAKPQRLGGRGDSGRAGDRRRARKAVPSPGGQTDENVGIGSDLLRLVQRSPQRGRGPAHHRRGPPGLVGGGDFAWLVFAHRDDKDRSLRGPLCVAISSAASVLSFAYGIDLDARQSRP